MKIENYGDLLAQGLDSTLLAYKEFGSYQGDYIAVLKNKDEHILIYKGYYGSCSGCDWLEAKQDWNTGEVPQEQINEFVSHQKAFLVIDDYRKIKAMIESPDLSVFFPANTRNNYDDWNWEDIRDLIKESVKTYPIQ